MSNGAEKKERHATLLRTVIAVGIGLIGAVLIWVVTPWNNNYFGLSELSGSYLPTGALFLLFILALGVNPLLRSFAPSLVLTRSQLLVITAILLMASVHPSHGLMRYLPSMLAGGPFEASATPPLAEAYAKADVPPALFPAKMEAGAPVPASSHFMDELPEGQPIPWRAWLRPLAAWGSLLGFGWLMLLGLSVIVYNQWCRNERLPFPLAEALGAPLAEPERGRRLPPIFNEPAFWAAVGIVLFLYVLMGLNRYFPNRVPAIPLSWNLTSALRGTPLEYASSPLRGSRIFFVLLGISFFMPTRVSFSIWFFAVLFSGYQIIQCMYFPPFNWGAVRQYNTGAMFAVAGYTLWLGRAQWARVARSLVRAARTEEDQRNRTAGYFFLAGVVGMFAWLLWVGVEPHWALFFIFLAFLASLVAARVVAETGLPYLRMEAILPSSLLLLVPTRFLSHATVFMASIMSILFAVCTRVNPTVIATHVFALDGTHGRSRQTRLMRGMLPVLLLGVVVCGAAHLQMCYRNNAPLNGNPPLATRGADFMRGTLNTVLKLEEGDYHPQTVYDHRPHIAFGAALTAGLCWATMVIPRWPLHPIGMLLVETTAANQAFGSVLFGWLAKVLLLRYGGSRLERRARPFFLGLIIGEVLATILWALVSAILAASGLPYETISVQPW